MAESAAAAFTWKEQDGILSPVRRNKDNTCVYRALCDAMDARVRIAARSTAGDAPFHVRFSAHKMLKKEARWASKPDGRRKHAMDYFVKKGLRLPVDKKEKHAATYKLASCDNLKLEKPEDVLKAKEWVRTDGPIIGGFKLTSDYKEPGIFCGVGQPVTARYFYNQPRSAPPPPEDVKTTSSSSSPSSSSSSTASSPPSAPKKSKKQTSTTATKNEEDDKPIPFASHAVCIVGYKRVDGVDCFHVQENQGKHAFEDGFRYVAVAAMKEVYVPVVISEV